MPKPKYNIDLNPSDFTDRDAYCKERRRRVYLLRRDEILAKDREYRTVHKDERNAYQKELRDKNIDKARAKDRERYQDPKRKEYMAEYWRKRYQRDKDKINARIEAHRLSHPDMKMARTENRRARALNAEGFFTAEDIQKILILQKYHCAYCGKDIHEYYTIDHVVPLSNGGTNWPNNLAMACKPCNSRKGTKDPERWAQEIGKLFV